MREGTFLVEEVRQTKCRNVKEHNVCKYCSGDFLGTQVLDKEELEIRMEDGDGEIQGQVVDAMLRSFEFLLSVIARNLK